MVCVSSNALADRVIREGAALARGLRAPWYAVYVETSQERGGQLIAARAEALARNFALAERLGGTVVRVTAASSGDGLVAFARREGITHAVFGETGRTYWERLLHGSPLVRFVSAIHGVAMQVVPATEQRSNGRSE